MFILALSSQSDANINKAWEPELGIQLSEEVWEDATSRMRSTTSCARLRLIQFNVVYRVLFSESRLSETYMENMECGMISAILSLAPCSHVFLCPKLNGC